MSYLPPWSGDDGVGTVLLMGGVAAMLLELKRRNKAGTSTEFNDTDRAREVLYEYSWTARRERSGSLEVSAV